MSGRIYCLINDFSGGPRELPDLRKLPFSQSKLAKYFVKMAIFCCADETKGARKPFPRTHEVRRQDASRS